MTVLYEDSDIIVALKEQGMLSEAGDGHSRSLPRILAGELSLRELPYPIHRLDREVGGALLLAKNARAAAKLSAMVQDMRKEYIAVTEGIPTSGAGTLKDLIFHDSMKNKTYTVSRPRKGVREAVLQYETLGTSTNDDGDRALIAVRPETGRTHQIRVQFASRGLPLAGDRKYGAKTAGRMGLFCRSLSFPHPITHKRMTVTADLPTDMPFSTFDCELPQSEQKSTRHNAPNKVNV